MVLFHLDSFPLGKPPYLFKFGVGSPAGLHNVTPPYFTVCHSIHSKAIDLHMFRSICLPTIGKCTKLALKDTISSRRSTRPSFCAGATFLFVRAASHLSPFIFVHYLPSSTALFRGICRRITLPHRSVVGVILKKGAKNAPIALLKPKPGEGSVSEESCNLLSPLSMPSRTPRRRST